MTLRSILTGSPTVAESPTFDASEEAMEEYQQDPSWSLLGTYLAKQVLTQEDEARRKVANDRLRLYQGGGVDLAESMVHEAFANDEVRALRIALVRYSRSHNLLRRLVDERARVYAKPPRVRAVAAGDDRYQELQRATDHNAALRWGDVRLALNNDCYIGFRVRPTVDGLAPRLDVLGPEDFTPVVDPHDPSSVVAIVIAQHPAPAPASNVKVPDVTRPHYLVWSPWESFQLDGAKRIILESIRPNPFGMIPGVLVSAAYRSTSPLDPVTGEDMVAAHLSCWLLRTIATKEAKSQNTQAAFMGETGRIATGQAQDSSRDLLLPDGIGISTIKRGQDVDQYLRLADHIEERCAATYGIPPSVLRHAGATSGYEIDLRRIPLEELREDRIQIWRRAERRLAEIQSIVLRRDLPALSFGTSGWVMDFAEIKRPLTLRETYEVRKLMRGSGHSNPVSEAMEDNPDFDQDQAAEFVADNVQAWAVFIDMVRKMNVSSDASATVPGRSPEANGGAEGDDESSTDSTLS